MIESVCEAFKRMSGFLADFRLIKTDGIPDDFHSQLLSGTSHFSTDDPGLGSLVWG